MRNAITRDAATRARVMGRQSFLPQNPGALASGSIIKKGNTTVNTNTRNTRDAAEQINDPAVRAATLAAVDASEASATVATDAEVRSMATCRTLAEATLYAASLRDKYTATARARFDTAVESQDRQYRERISTWISEHLSEVAKSDPVLAADALETAAKQAQSKIDAMLAQVANLRAQSGTADAPADVEAAAA